VYYVNLDLYVPLGQRRVPRLRYRPPSPTSKSLQFRLRGELAASIASVRTEIAEAKSELIRWSVGSIFASVGMFAAITRLLAH